MTGRRVEVIAGLDVEPEGIEGWFLVRAVAGEPAVAVLHHAGPRSWFVHLRAGGPRTKHASKRAAVEAIAGAA